MIIPAISAVTRQVAVYRQQKKHPGPSFEQAKITSAAHGLEERAEFDADPAFYSEIPGRCRPCAGRTPRPKEQSDFDLGGPKTELVYRVSERGCAAVQAREITGIHGSCLEYKLNQGG